MKKSCVNFKRPLEFLCNENVDAKTFYCFFFLSIEFIDFNKPKLRF